MYSINQKVRCEKGSEAYHRSTPEQHCWIKIAIILSCTKNKEGLYRFRQRKSTVTSPASSRSCYPICDPNSGRSHVIRESLQPSSLSLSPLLALQVRQFLIPGIAMPVVGTIEQRRVVEPYSGPATTAIRSSTPLKLKHTCL